MLLRKLIMENLGTGLEKALLLKSDINNEISKHHAFLFLFIRRLDIIHIELKNVLIFHAKNKKTCNSLFIISRVMLFRKMITDKLSNVLEKVLLIKKVILMM